ISSHLSDAYELRRPARGRCDTMFINTLHYPFYDRMVGSVSSNFSDIVIIGERVESGLKNGKFSESSLNNIKKPFAQKKKEVEAHAIENGANRSSHMNFNTLSPTYASNPQVRAPMYYPPMVSYQPVPQRPPFMSPQPVRL
ncbi:hypothetical protein PIB30_104603, partial [Stylosanthes scabra]|nr:hypothetical protein [Stylosanthes scabra]